MSELTHEDQGLDDHGLEDYVARLELQLRMRDVPTARVAQIVAEVRTHVADTGEAPVDAFGAPAAYAQEYAASAAVRGTGLWDGWAWLARFSLFVVGLGLIRMLTLTQIETQSGVSVSVGLDVLLYLAGLGLLGGIVSRWVLRPFLERQAATSPIGTLAEAPRAMVLGGVATTLLDPHAFPQWFNGSPWWTSVGGPPIAMALVGPVLTALAVWLEIRAGRRSQSGPPPD